MQIAQISLPLTVSCFSKIQIDFTFLVPANLGSPGKGVCVCALGYAMYFRFVDDVMFADYRPGKDDGSIGPTAFTHDSSTGAAPMRRRSLVSTIALLLTALARKVMKSVMSVRPSVFTLLNQLTFDLDFCLCVGLDHSSPGMENQDHRSRVRYCGGNAVGLTSILHSVGDVL